MRLSFILLFSSFISAVGSLFSLYCSCDHKSFQQLWQICLHLDVIPLSLLSQKHGWHLKPQWPVRENKSVCSLRLNSKLGMIFLWNQTWLRWNLTCLSTLLHLMNTENKLFNIEIIYVQYSLFTRINKSTRVKDNSATLIDNMLTWRTVRDFVFRSFTWFSHNSRL